MTSQAIWLTMKQWGISPFSALDAVIQQHFYVQETPLSELIFKISSSLLKSVSFWKLLLPKETHLEEISELPAG